MENNVIPKIGCRLKGDIFASITERPRPVIYTYKYVVIKEGYKHTKQTKTKRTKNKQTKTKQTKNKQTKTKVFFKKWADDKKTSMYKDVCMCI